MHIAVKYQVIYPELFIISVVAIVTQAVSSSICPIYISV